MSSGNVMSFAYPDAGLAFRSDGNLVVLGLAFRWVVRGGLRIRSMPRSLSLLLIDPAGDVQGVKSFATQTIGMSHATCEFVANFDLARDLATTEPLDGDWTLRLSGEFRAEDGSMSESTIERRMRIVTPPKIRAQSVYPSWLPTPPDDGPFVLTWTRPQPEDARANLPIPVSIRTEHEITGHYPVVELLDNANQVVVTSIWLRGWTRHAPLLRTTVKGPKNLDGKRNTHHFRLSVIEPGSSSRSASSYRSLQPAGTGQPTIQAAGAAAPDGVSFSVPEMASQRRGGKAEVTTRVNLNQASAAEIARTLPGIGPALAKKIVAARPVKSLDQLIAIRGLSPLTVESIRGLVEW